MHILISFCTHKKASTIHKSKTHKLVGTCKARKRNPLYILKYGKTKTFGQPVTYFKLLNLINQCTLVLTVLHTPLKKDWYEG